MSRRPQCGSTEREYSACSFGDRSRRTQATLWVLCAEGEAIVAGSVLAIMGPRNPGVSLRCWLGVGCLFVCLLAHNWLY